MGHGLDDYTKRHGGNKMRIEFTAGVKRPKDAVQAAKFSSEVGFYTRNNMPIATHWKQCKKDETIQHVIPEAINKVAVSPHYLIMLTNMLIISATKFTFHIQLYFVGKV
jgi:hypothetical protein